MSKIVTLAELKKHNKGDDCWIAINDVVYDVTSFIDDHPGGEDTITNVAGDYATEPFEDTIHSSEAQEQMNDYKIGEMAASDKEVRPKCTLNRQQSSMRAAMLGLEPEKSEATTGSEKSWMMKTAVGVLAVGLLYKIVLSR